MHEAVAVSAREGESTYAPRMVTFKINPEKIRDVIGKGGAVIRALSEETRCQINIEDDGTITIASPSGEDLAECKKRIDGITAEVEVGKVYDGTMHASARFRRHRQRAAGQGWPAAYFADRQ
jgi:polyribonucleotide nucleotidyltransferase